MTGDDPIAHAARAIVQCDALVISAGAGMGVDSGLPDFRGNDGFWRAYPPFARLGLSFYELANPRWFSRDPSLAWGFYGHRLMLYRATTPHAGFGMLRRWADTKRRGSFVFTSNVDGHFQQSGFDGNRIVECHGSIGWLQCMDSCGIGIFSAEGASIDVDPRSFRALDPLPVCPSCGALARPNVLMFGDWQWDEARTAAQHERLDAWLQEARREGPRVVVIECGAGTSVPTVRHFAERTAMSLNGLLMRINPREPRVPANHLSLPMSALEALSAIDQIVADALGC